MSATQTTKHDLKPDPKFPDAAPTIPDTTSLSVPAKEDYENPALTAAEEERERLNEVARLNDEVIRKQGEQALEYYRSGITQPSESDLRVGMSHPTIGNRPGYSPDPVAERYQPSERTLAEMEAGKAATPKLAEEQSAGKEAGKEAAKKLPEEPKSKG